MDGKVFTKETTNKLVKVISDLLNLPFYLKWIATTVIKMALNFLNEKADKYVPDSIDPIINESINLTLSGDYDAASEKVGTALANVIDIPLLDEDDEHNLFVNAISFILRLVNKWINKKKEVS